MKGLSVDAARAVMLAATPRMDAEAVPLEQAAGRVLAEPVQATRDQPPFDASAMDGWAVRRADAARAGTLRIVGESAAGRGHESALGPGEAVRIFTGAPVPEGADLVVIQEEAERDGEHVRLGPVSQGPSNIRPRGGDFRAGRGLLEAGVTLDAWRLSLAAAAGRGELRVARRPRVAVLGTGEELVRPPTLPGPFQIYESGSIALCALIEAWGGTAQRLAPARDDESAIVDAVREVAADLIVTIGGASVGDYDLVKPAMRRLGLTQQIDSVNVRPGKPTWFGALADGRLILGLPGNPASALVCAELFLRPVLAAFLGAGPSPGLEVARLAEPLPGNGPREHYMRAVLGCSDEGIVTVRPMPDQDSSLVTVFSQANGLLRRLPRAEAAEAGAVVEVIRLGRL